MAQKTRLANKTMWALEDITSRSKDARRRWDELFALAERRLDPVLMQKLGRLRDDLAFIERKAKDALQGEYQQEGE